MSRTTRLWLLVAPAAVVIGATASALMYFSEHQDVPRLQAVITALIGGSFIVAGLIARTRRPLNRTGLLMIAVGFAWFVSAGLMASNESLPWTIGLSLSAVPAGFLVHLLIAYPSGRLQSRSGRTAGQQRAGRLRDRRSSARASVQIWASWDNCCPGRA